MDGEFHFAAALFDQLGQLAHLVLGLGHRHAVAGNHDHVAGIGQLHGGVLDRDAADRLAGQRRRQPAAAAALPPNAPNSTLANERFMALLIRIDSRKPLAPSSAPAMISTLLLQRKARGRRRQAGIGVEQRDHDRHVGPADRQHDQHADGQPDHDHQIEHHRMHRAGRGDDHQVR